MWPKARAVSEPSIFAPAELVKVPPWSSVTVLPPFNVPSLVTVHACAVALTPFETVTPAATCALEPLRVSRSTWPVSAVISTSAAIAPVAQTASTSASALVASKFPPLAASKFLLHYFHRPIFVLAEVHSGFGPVRLTPALRERIRRMRADAGIKGHRGWA